ncbi:aa3-type cytochrome c oxidase subunit IV [Sphingomonas sp. ASV193]
MAANEANQPVTEMDYPAHERNYTGFLKLLKVGIVVVAIVTVVVVMIIAN